MSLAPTPAIDHVGINIPQSSFAFWQDLLGHLGAVINVGSQISCRNLTADVGSESDTTGL